MRKSKIISLIALATAAAGLASCGDNAKCKIGVLLPVEHEALQTCAAGFKEALLEAGLVEGTDFSYEIRNAGGKEVDLSNMAKDLVSSKDMTFGLGTGASKMLMSSSIDKGLTNPVFFSAVTDPVAAGLVESNENKTGFVCGTSDAQPIEDQLQLILKINPSADKLGVLYTAEENSVLQVEQVKSIISRYAPQVQVVEKLVQKAEEINANALALASEDGIDAIYVPTDNTIAAQMNDVKQAANSKGVLLVCGEEGMVKNGGHISISVDYKLLGKEAGKMAVEIIKNGAKPTDFAVKYMSKETCASVYSSANLAGSGIEIPETVLKEFTDVSAK